MSNTQQQEGESLEEIVLTREQLEEMRREQETSFNYNGTKSDKGIGMLLIEYIKARGESKISYLNNSEYVTRDGLNVSTSASWFIGNAPFHLRPMKGFVRELGVSEEYLRFVAGRDPFTPTDEELERWSEEKGGVRNLIKFHVGMPLLVYLRNSEYVKSNDVTPEFINGWLKSYRIDNIPLKHLCGLVDELEIPRDQIESVLGRYPFTPTEEELERWSEDDNGIKDLIKFYIDLRHGVPVEEFIGSRSEYLRMEGGKISSAVKRFLQRGDKKDLSLKHLKGVVDELEVPNGELEIVYGRNPFKPTDDELYKWSRDDARIRKLFEFYIDLRHGVAPYAFYTKQSNYMQDNGLNFGKIRAWLIGKNPFPLKHLKGLVDELEVDKGDLETVCGRDPFTPTDEELEEWSKDEKKGVGKLLAFYVSLHYGVKPPTFLSKNSDYVKRNKLNPDMVYANGFTGSNCLPIVHIDGLARELQVPREELNKVVGEDVSESFSLSQKDLEDFRRTQEGSPGLGIGKLLGFYIRTRKKSAISPYIRDQSKYLRDNNIAHVTASSWFYGRAYFPLKHLKGLVDELEVDKGDLEFVAGRNPFEVTEEELDGWKDGKGGLRNLFAFYINLNYGLKYMDYLRDKSEYVKEMDVGIRTIVSQIYKKTISPQHLKGFAEEVGIPPEQVKRVTGIDIEEIVELTRGEILEEMRESQEESKHSKGIGSLITERIYNLGHNKKEYFDKRSPYLKTERVNPLTIRSWIIGANPFPLKYMKGLVDELEVDQGELEYVAGRNPFEPTEDELDEWSREKIVKGLIEFYISLRHGTNITEYLRDVSDFLEDKDISPSTFSGYLYGHLQFPPQYLKGVAEELEIPPEQVKRVTGVDITKVRSVGEEMDELLGGFLVDE